jgi:hypothetical protein
VRVVLVPGVLALLPEYAGQLDPVAELRAAALDAVSSLGTDVTVLGEPRVAAYLLRATSREGDEPSYLVVGNGSAKRTEKAPGHLDERATAFDTALGESLWRGRPEVDVELAHELWADVAGIVAMAELGDLGEAQVDHVGDPYGVQYWVMRWSC